MAFDTHYMLGPNLQDFVIDAQTGLPLTDGIAYFFSDINRNVPKAVYTIAGTSANYTFTDIGATVQFSSVGTTTDNNGNDIKIYYYPYITIDGELVVENYFVQVYDMAGNLQFTRENWPGISAESAPTSAVDITNFIPNGQFLFHNDNPNPLTVTTTANGAMTVVSDFTGYPTAVDIWQIAPGGWTYERSHGSSATDTITFVDQENYTSLYQSSPRYTCEINRTIAGNDAISDLRIKFNDVNKFQGTTLYLYFNAKSDAATVNMNVNLIQYFGSGGAPSPTITNLLETVAVSPSTTPFVLTIDFTLYPTVAQSIGSNNDDYVQIAFNLPGTTGSLFNVEFTDVFLSVDPLFTTTILPPQTNGDYLETALFNTAPSSNPDGSQYYAHNGSTYFLPMVMTSQGMQFDYSSIGTIIAAARPAMNNELPTDGNGYVTSNHSALGIPYSRLQKALYNSTTGTNIWGNGFAFANAYIDSGATTDVVLYTNQPGAQTATTDGAVATNFTFQTLFTGSTTINYNAYANSTGLVTAVSTFLAPAAGDVGAGTSGMTVADLVPYNGTGYYYAFSVQAIAASSLAAGSATPGKYFIFSNAATAYYMWFQVTTETDPAPGGTGIKVILQTNMAALDVGIAIANALSQFQGSLITCGAGATVAAGSYWQFHAAGVTYTPWYQVGGLPTTAPSVTNPIAIVISGTATAIQVATATQQAINMNFVGTPYLTGAFLRGADTTGVWDIDHAKRWSAAGNIVGGAVGSFEYGQLMQHLHQPSAATSQVYSQDGTNPVQPVYGANTGIASAYYTVPTHSNSAQAAYPWFVNNPVTALAGGTETRPINVSVNLFIKY